MSDQDVVTTSFASQLSRHRSARRISQLDLANICGISTRHLSFLESGRAQPSREMVLRLCEGLLLAPGVQNALLLTAGFAPVFPSSPLHSEALEPFRRVLDEMMARHAPNPAMLVDRYWNVHEANQTARLLLRELQGDSREQNLPRLLVESPRAASAISNFAEVLHEITSRLQVEALEAGDDPMLADLVMLLQRASEANPLNEVRKRRPVLPLELDFGGVRWSFLSVIAHFGTSEDATIRDLRLELLFPADAHTREAVIGLADKVS